MAPNEVRAWLTNIGVLAARPAAFAVFLLYAALWIVFGNGLEWHSLATLATWGMTLVIQRAEHTGHSCQARRTAEGSWRCQELAYEYRRQGR